MTLVIYSRNILEIDDKEVILPHQILEAFELQGAIVVFLDPDANLGKAGQYRNLIAYDSNGTKIWEAALPTMKASDVYWKIVSKTPLIAYSFSSYECEIDITTGKVLRKNFYK